MEIDNDILTLQRVESISSGDRISDIEIVNDYVYVASRSGIKKFNSQNDQEITELLKGDAKSLKVTEKSTVLSGFSNNILYVNDEKIFQVDSYNPLTNESITINDIEKHGENMYVATNDGILVFDLRKNTLVEFVNAKNSKLESDIINFLFTDSKNRLWVGSKKGVMYKKSSTKGWSKIWDTSFNYIAATENKEGVWLISDEKMWNINATDDRWSDVGLNQGLYKGNINDLTVDIEGNIYIASDVLVKFNPYTDETIQYSDILGMASQRCLSLEADRKGDIWLGTENSGLYKITKDPEKRETLLLTSIVEENILCEGQGSAKVKVAASGGLEPYQYTWSPAYVKGDNPSGLKPGKYQVNVVDARGTSASTIVTVEDALPIEVQITNIIKASSANSKDGKCDITVTGGLAPYTIEWDNGETGTSASRLNFGFHYINITDANNCTVEHKINVSKQSEMKSLRNANLAVGEKLRIDNLYFEADSSAVKGKSIDALEDIFVFLTDNDQLIIEIGGHTNNIPPDEYCDNLSSARAKSVTEYLIRRGIPKDRISYKGYGKKDPIASNNTAAGRKRNQRVEMKILEIKE